MQAISRPQRYAMHTQQSNLQLPIYELVYANAVEIENVSTSGALGFISLKESDSLNQQETEFCDILSHFRDTRKKAYLTIAQNDDKYASIAGNIVRIFKRQSRIYFGFAFNEPFPDFDLESSLEKARTL